VINTFNTCSRELTHQSLTDIDGGYNPRGVGFSHHSSCSFQPTVILFLAKGSCGLQLTKLHKKLPRTKCHKVYCRHMVSQQHGDIPLPTSMPSQCYQLLTSNRINKDRTESNPNASRHQSNSYNLMHNQYS
jgi:hypothetical protein